jgi:hypothetical protein
MMEVRGAWFSSWVTDDAKGVEDALDDPAAGFQPQISAADFAENADKPNI